MQVDRVRLLVCGAADVGKTSLICSLKTRFLRSFRSLKCGGSYLGPAAYQHTFGFCVEQANIPTAGNFSIWDLSGHKEYYLAHEYIMESKNTIYVMVYSNLHSCPLQLAQVRFWLAMIKSKHRPNQFIHYGGQRGQKPFVILVQSFTDDSSQTAPVSRLGYDDNEDLFTATLPKQHREDCSLIIKSTPYKLLQQLVDEFGHHFMFTDKVFCLDCRQPRGKEIQSLRTLLGTLRQSVLKVRHKRDYFEQGVLHYYRANYVLPYMHGLLLFIIPNIQSALSVN